MYFLILLESGHINIFLLRQAKIYLFIYSFFLGKQKDFTQHKRKQSPKFSRRHRTLWIDLNSCELIMPTRLRVYVIHQAKGHFSWNYPSSTNIFQAKKKEFNIFLHSWKLSLKSPSLSPPILSFSGIHKVRKFLWNLIMKCWNSAFNAKGSRVIIVIVQMGAVKKYICSSSGGAQEKERRGWNSVLHQNWWKN